MSAKCYDCMGRARVSSRNVQQRLSGSESEERRGVLSTEEESITPRWKRSSANKQIGWWGAMGGPKQKGIYTYCEFGSCCACERKLTCVSS